jgi:transcriptional regulator GlxA family with amidase domain
MTQFKRRNVGILVFNDVEVLDFCGPFEVFATARHAGDAPREERRLYNAYTIAEKGDIVVCRGGLLVKPHYTLRDHPHFDLLVIPGGFGVEKERENPAVLNWIRAQTTTAEVTTSVCTGSFLLGAIGALDGKQATTHWGSIDSMRERHPAIDTIDDRRVIDEGSIVTSAGISAGIDMALYMLARLNGIDVARDTARNMEYIWNEEGIGLEQLAARS